MLGASGFIGGYLIGNLRRKNIESVGTWFQHPAEGFIKLDCSDVWAVEEFLEQGNFDSVIVAAAQPNVEWCETHPAESHRFNTIPMRNLYSIMSSSKLRKLPHIIFISSDYVFDGRNGPYIEEDPPNPLNVYGEHKLEAETYALKVNAAIVRTTVVYGKEKNQKNFAERLINNILAQKTVFVPSDQIGSPTYVEDLAVALTDLALKNVTGIYHVAGSELISRYEFALRIAHYMRLDSKKIVPILTSELKQIAKRPLSAGLLCDKLKQALGWELSSVELGLEKFINLTLSKE